MATQSSCSGSALACALRLATLDDNGVPRPGAGNLAVTDQMVQIGINPSVETGADLVRKNGCGAIKVALKVFDVLKRYDLTLQLAYPDPELTKMLLGGGDLLISGTEILGYAYPALGTTPAIGGTSVEFWTERVGAGGQALDYGYWRWVLPRTYWQIANRTAGEEVMTTEFTGFAVENANWYDGPANDWPHLSTRALMYRKETSLPLTSCGTQLLAAS